MIIYHWQRRTIQFCLVIQKDIKKNSYTYRVDHVLNRKVLFAIPLAIKVINKKLLFFIKSILYDKTNFWGNLLDFFHVQTSRHLYQVIN